MSGIQLRARVRQLLLHFRSTSPVVGRRDLRLDLLRGFAVLAMVVDHVAGISPLYALTGGNRFFVSAAEGFVFISGLLVGVVYGGLMRRDGFRAAARKALRRAFTLYTLAVWLTIGFAAFSTLLGLPWAPDFEATSVGDFILQTITFQRAYYLVDVMQLYTLLLLATPPALWLLGRGKWKLLLAASAGLWAAYQLSGGQIQIPWQIRDNVVFNLAAWQILFFVAMTIGYVRLSGPRPQTVGQAEYRRPRVVLPGGWLGPLTLAVAGLIWLHLTNGAVLAQLGLVTDPAAAFDVWFNKAAVPPLRLAAAGIVFAFAWSLVSRVWPVIGPVLGQLLMPLGANALYAYAAHIFIAGALEAAGNSAPDLGARLGLDLGEAAAGRWGPTTSLVLQVGALLAVALIVRWRVPLRLVGWLGEAPVQARSAAAGRSHAGRRLSWHLSPSLMAIAGVSALSATVLATTWPDVGTVNASAHLAASATSETANLPRVAVTVTAKRRISEIAPNGVTQDTVTPEQLAAAGQISEPTPMQLENNLPALVPAATPVAELVMAEASNATPDEQPEEPSDRIEAQRAEQVSVTARSTAAPAGSVLDDLEFFSPTLGRKMPYGIYLPAGYDQDTSRRYPVMYLLHGGPTNYAEWAWYGIQKVTDDLIASGKAQPMILVLAEGEGSYFFNHQDGPAWGDYIAHDLVQYIDSTERTIPERASRGVAGLSMGAHGALQLVFNYPDVFGIAAAHSPSLRSADLSPDAYVFLKGLPFFGTPAYYKKYDPLALAKTAKVKPLALWIDAGDDDPWLEEDDQLNATLNARGWAHDYHIFPGRHETAYWVKHLPEYVKWWAGHLAE